MRKILLGVSSLAVVVLAVLFLVYPAWVVGSLVIDPRLRATGESRFVPAWFLDATPRFTAWA